MLPQTSVRSLSQILHKCIEEKKKNELFDVFRLYSYMKRDGLANLASVRSLVGLMLLSIPNGQKVFDEFVHNNEYGSCFDSLIIDLIKAQELRHALMLYERIGMHSLHLNDYTFVSLLKVCADLQDEEKGHHIHGVVNTSGCLQRNIFIGNALVNMYAKCGAIHKVRDIFYEMPFRDVVSWTTVIAGLIDYKYYFEALDCFEKMQFEGILPNVATMACLLKACGNIGAIDKGQKLHASLYAKELAQKNVMVGNALVDMYGKCGFLTKARELFDEMLVRDVISWTTLIAGYVTHEHGNKAVNCFDQMQLEGVSPNVATFACTLKACGSTGAKDKGREIHEMIIKEFLHKDIVIGNALMDMYAKCGLLTKSHSMFESFVVRDVVAWTVVIASYAENDLCEEALDSLEQMQFEGVSPNAYTYVCILKACADVRALDKGQEIHSQILVKGLWTTHIVSSSLVYLYSECGSFIDAEDVFNKHTNRNVSAWNALISGYVKHGHAILALDCFYEMQNKGLSPNVITFISTLKACGILGNVKRGLELHAEIARKGLLEKRDILIGNALLGMYVNCGDFSMAHEIFNSLPVQDTSSWNVLISGFVNRAYANEALNYFKHMRISGVYPNAATVVWSLKACGILKAIDQGKEIHNEITKNVVLKRDHFVGNALVEMYAKCGFLRKARDVFDNLLCQDMTSWNLLVVEYSRWGYSEEVLTCLKQMQSHGISPDAITLSCSLKACSVIGNLEKGKGLHADIIKAGSFEQEFVVGNALVYMYAQCGSLAKAYEMLEKLGTQDVYSWTALITGYIKHRNYEEALSCYNQMQLKGVFPNAITLSCLLEACGCIGVAEKGRNIHAEISSRGFLKGDIVIGNALVDMYGKCGLFSKALEVFNNLPTRDTITWTVLIGGYVKHELGKEALHCYEQMLVEGFPPDAATFVITLKACSLIGALIRGLEIHEEISRRGLSEGNLSIGNALVNLYAKCGSLTKAQEMFEKLIIHDITSWNTLIAGYVQARKNAMVFFLFDRMQRVNQKANAITFFNVLRACRQTDLMEKGITYFQSISRDYGIIPVLEHYTCLVSLLGCAGYLDRALTVVEKMPLYPDDAVRRALMDGCQRWGSVQLGRKTFENAQQAMYPRINNLFANSNGFISFVHREAFSIKRAFGN